PGVETLQPGTIFLRSTFSLPFKRSDDGVDVLGPPVPVGNSRAGRWRNRRLTGEAVGRDPSRIARARRSAAVKFSSILLIGPPGVGKGTQGEVPGSLPGLLHCAGGDVFRALDANSGLGRSCAEYSCRGELVPVEYTVRLWHKRLQDLASVGEWN